MKAHRLVQRMSPELAGEAIDFLRDEEKEAYRAAVSMLASRRKLRPVFVQKKSRREQTAWVLKMLPLRTNDDLAEHILQVWLMKRWRDMLIEFLDEAGVEHDGEGAVDNLPDELAPAKVSAAVDKILASYPPEVVNVYLLLFQQQREGGWPAVDAAVCERDALPLKPDGDAR